jgi:hypothetical protein
LSHHWIPTVFEMQSVNCGGKWNNFTGALVNAGPWPRWH